MHLSEYKDSSSNKNTIGDNYNQNLISKTAILTLMGLPIHKSINLGIPDKNISFKPNTNDDYFHLIVNDGGIQGQNISQDISHSSNNIIIEWCIEDSEIISLDIKDICYAPTINNLIPDQKIYIYSNFNFNIDTIIYSQIDGNYLTLIFKWKRDYITPCRRSFDITTGKSYNLLDRNTKNIEYVDIPVL